MEFMDQPRKFGKTKKRLAALPPATKSPASSLQRSEDPWSGNTKIARRRSQSPSMDAQVPRSANARRHGRLC